MAVHVIDALFICGTDVRQFHYNERFVLQTVADLTVTDHQTLQNLTWTDLVKLTVVRQIPYSIFTSDLFLLQITTLE